MPRRGAAPNGMRVEATAIGWLPLHAGRWLTARSPPDGPRFGRLDALMARRALTKIALAALLFDGSHLCLMVSPPRHDSEMRMSCCKRVDGSGPIACPCHHRGSVIGGGDAWLPAAMPAVTSLPLPAATAVRFAVVGQLAAERSGPPVDRPPRSS